MDPYKLLFNEGASRLFDRGRIGLPGIPHPQLSSNLMTSMVRERRKDFSLASRQVSHDIRIECRPLIDQIQ